MRLFAATACVLLGLATLVPAQAQQTAPKWSPRVQTVLDTAKPLVHSRGNRLPLYLWPAMDPGVADDATAEYLVRELDKRGIGLACSWSPEAKDQTLARGLAVARAQKKLGLMVNCHATSCTYSYFNGDEKTAHVDARGEAFFDSSFGGQKMGCPFALDFRKETMRERVEMFVREYQNAGIPIDFLFADWEIDGPIEFNRAWEASKKCVRCLERIPDIDNFASFQKALREIRNDLQRNMLTEPVLSRFPDALVGNYAVYPHDGWRYWYDYFEYYVDGQPYQPDQRAKYRKWYDDFPGAGFTFAMPVVYTWYPTYQWYDFDDPDYRWFYNMLLVASNAGKSTPADVPVISFVHWHTTSPPKDPDPSVRQFSEEKYQELLWHMLLRGTDTFFLWCVKEEDAKEVSLLQPVWAAAQEYGEFLEKGTPVTFEVPRRPGPVVSGLRLGNRVLVRRTDFGDAPGPVNLTIDGKTLSVKPFKGKCRILTLE